MRQLFLLIFFSLTFSTNAQTVKSKSLKLKYTLNDGWTAKEFGDPLNWDKGDKTICNCAGVAFSKPDANGKYNIVVYAVPMGGLDSAKREFVGTLKFVQVEKVERAVNEYFSFERRRSNFIETKTNSQSYNCMRYITKPKDGYCYMIYAWQENMSLLNSTSERELVKMINVIAPL
jgi:hypothetical protein